MAKLKLENTAPQGKFLNIYRTTQISAAVITLVAAFGNSIIEKINPPENNNHYLELHFDFHTEDYYLKLSQTPDPTAIDSRSYPYKIIPPTTTIKCTPDLQTGNVHIPNSYVIYYHNNRVEGYEPTPYTTFYIAPYSLVIKITPGEVDCKTSIPKSFPQEEPVKFEGAKGPA